MSDNPKLHNNAVSNPPPDEIQEGIWKLKVCDNKEGDSAQSNQYPNRPGQPDCIYYLRTGVCAYGINCRYNHPSDESKGIEYTGELPQRAGQPDCEYFLKTGTCKYGPTCKYHHPRDRNGARPVSLNILGLPIRQQEKPCPYYMKNGSCKFGAACKFHHPEPLFPGNVIPVNGSSTSGSNSPYINDISGPSTWKVTGNPYITGSSVQSPQPYMHAVYSPYQGIVPTHGWNSYLGNMTPINPASVLGPASHVYGSTNHGESASNGSIQLLSPLNQSLNFPERPDQPDCRYFINTGSCKYGSDCKYNHPKERIAQIANTVGPLGLPLRPGQPECSHYNLYGLCKYGPTCKFDHPLARYPFTYGLSLPSPSIIDQTIHYYPRNLSPAHASSERYCSVRVTEIPEDHHEHVDSPHTSETQPD